MQNSESDSYDEDRAEEAGGSTASDDTFPSPRDLNVNLHYVHFLLLDQNHLRLNSRKLSRGSRISRRDKWQWIFKRYFRCFGHNVLRDQ